jgi:hypothetical protein
MPVDVSTALPQLDLPALAIVTVTLDDPSAVITSLNAHGWQTIPPGAPAPSSELLVLQPLPDPPPPEPDTTTPAGG